MITETLYVLTILSLLVVLSEWLVHQTRLRHLGTALGTFLGFWGAEWILPWITG